jgi:chemotaxis protein MotB
VEGKSIIIKRVKKVAHGGGHGGSWKVAYADFVTAMMAFFLLLWLLSMVSPEKKAKLSQYFRSFSVFEKSAGSLVDMHKPNNPVLGTSPIPEIMSEDVVTEVSSPATAQFQEKMTEQVKTRLSEFKEQIRVESFEGGVRMEIMETEGRPMFLSASTELTSEGRKVMQVIAENLQKNKSKIAIEGHTDAKGFASGRLSNWELSTDRASAARKELERNGVGPERLVRIAGLAATQPLIKDNPLDSRNRRISILLLSDPSSVQTPIPGMKATPGATPTSGTGLPERRKIVRGNFQFDPVEQYLKGGR